MTARTSSLVHPKYKTKYTVKNWHKYEQGLRNRGDVMIWCVGPGVPCKGPFFQQVQVLPR